MLALYLVIKLVISIGLLLSLGYVCKKMHGNEIIAVYLVSSSTMHILANIVSLNMRMFNSKGTPLTLSILEIDRLMLIPLLTIWLVYLYKRMQDKGFLKFLMTILWASIFVLLIYLNIFAGVYKPTGWNALVGFVEMFALYLIVVSFQLIFLTQLEKEVK